MMAAALISMRFIVMLSSGPGTRPGRWWSGGPQRSHASQAQGKVDGRLIQWRIRVRGQDLKDATQLSGGAAHASTSQTARITTTGRVTGPVASAIRYAPARARLSLVR